MWYLMRLTGKAAGASPGTCVRVGQGEGLCQKRPMQSRSTAFPQRGPQTVGSARAGGAPWTNSFFLLYYF